MAAQPIAAFLAVALPRDEASIAENLLDGMLPLAEQFDVALAGGDTNVWDGRLVVSITLIGRCPHQPHKMDDATSTPQSILLNHPSIHHSLSILPSYTHTHTPNP